MFGLGVGLVPGFFRLGLAFFWVACVARAELYSGTLAELEAREKALVAEYRRIQADGLTAENLVNDLGAASEGDREKIYEAWRARNRPFVAEYDRFNDDKLDFLLQRYRQFAADIQAGVDGSARYTAEEKKRIESLHKELEGQFRRYRDHKGQMGLAGDRERTLASNNFFATAQKFSVAAGRPDQSWSQWLGQKSDAWYQGLRMRGAQLGLLTSLPVALAEMASGRSPVMAAKLPLRSALAAQGRGLEFSGAEPLKTPPAPGTLRVIAMPHSHNVNDLSTLATLATKKTAMVSIPWPGEGRVSRFLDSKPQIVRIYQDGGRRMAEDLAGRVRSGQIDTVILFPESILPAYGYELRPPQEKLFGEAMAALREIGVPTEVIPIALPRHAQFLTKVAQNYDGMDSSKLPVEVQGSIAPSVVSFLTARGEGALGEVVRLAWLDANDRDAFQGRELGMPSIGDLTRAIDRRLTEKTGCPFSLLNP
jgi:hypothetical protein